MITSNGIPEARRAEEFLSRAVDERDLWELLDNCRDSLVIAPQGFEERSLGVLEGMAQRRFFGQKVVCASYPPDSDGLNELYRRRFINAAAVVSLSEPSFVQIDAGGDWLAEAVRQAPDSPVILDMTALSNRLIFPTLDTLAQLDVPVLIAYTEAREYWPTKEAWHALRKTLAPTADIGDAVDEQRWLFGQDHEVGFVAGHEGFETAAGGHALIGFLPFKCARLAAITQALDFSSSVFIAGVPRLPENSWRRDALKEINSRLVGRWPVVEMSTFGYRSALWTLLGLLSDESCSLLKYNVHISILGSKLQNIACWALTRLLPEITLVFSAPLRYYRKSFSDGIGTSWGFLLTDPLSPMGGSDDATVSTQNLASGSRRGSSEVT